MFASEFFLEVERCDQLNCSKIVVNAAGCEITRVRCHNRIIGNPASLLVLKDLYPPNVYMYARFTKLSPSYKEVEIFDSNAREVGDLQIEGVEANGLEMVISARIIGAD